MHARQRPGHVIVPSLIDEYLLGHGYADPEVGCTQAACYPELKLPFTPAICTDASPSCGIQKTCDPHVPQCRAEEAWVHAAVGN